MAGGILAIALSLALAWRYTPLAAWISADSVTAWVDGFSAHWWAPVLIVLAYTPASFLLFPRPLITLAAVLAFGAGPGLAYAMTGIVFAASIAFAIGRLLNRDTVRRLVGERLDRIAAGLRRHGLLAMIAVRLAPVAPFVVVNIAAGAIRVRYWHFAVGTALGMLPGAVIATVFGYQLKTALRAPDRIDYWLIGGLVVLTVVLGLVFRKRALRIFADVTRPVP